MADTKPPVQKCPICVDSPAKVGELRELINVDCACCGSYKVTGTAMSMLPFDVDEVTLATMAYHLRRMTDRDERPRLDAAEIKRLRDSPPIPTPDLMVDEFVLWLGRHFPHAGQALDLAYPEHRAVLGVVGEDGFNYMLTVVHESEWFTGKLARVLSGPWQYIRCALTPAGWQRFRQLSAAQVTSRFGFMAMKYGDRELDSVVRDFFAPAVQAAGFGLRRLDQDQAAGLIDDQMRVQIRTARFLICDLTHGNRGAYWEAGFAEGLGRPVIYTCRKEVFEDRKHENHPHFDTGHLVTIPWDPADLQDAAKRLTATIRVTLPTEAKLQDTRPE